MSFNSFNKKQIAKMVRDGAAGIIASADLDQLLGTVNHDLMSDDHEAMTYVEECQRKLVKRIEG